MPGLARRAGAVEVDQRRQSRRSSGFSAVNCGSSSSAHCAPPLKSTCTTVAVPARLGRSELAERLLGPLGRLLGEVEIEVDAVGGARAAQRLQTLVDRLAGRRRTSRRPCRPAPARQSARRRCAARRRPSARCRSRRRAAADRPRPRSEANTMRFLALATDGEVGVGQVDDAWRRALLLRQLLAPYGERFGVAALARIKNRQRLARLGRHGSLRRRRHRPARPRSRRKSRRASARCCGVVRATTLLSASISSGVNGAFFGSNGWAVTNASSTFLASARRAKLPPSAMRLPWMPPRRDPVGLYGFAIAGALRLIYLDLVGPRQPGAGPVEANENYGRAANAGIGDGARQRRQIGRHARARSRACRSRR